MGSLLVGRSDGGGAGVRTLSLGRGVEGGEKRTSPYIPPACGWSYAAKSPAYGADMDCLRDSAGGNATWLL